MWIRARVTGVIDGVPSVMSHCYLLKAKRDARWLIKKLGREKILSMIGSPKPKNIPWLNLLKFKVKQEA